ncbi:glycosyltransferase [Arthrobacter sp. CC3]|uniref:glycosyltransferase n=1 Tax=Arthrobacter sp. CC3 TaxID=3029185 RepID=UPI003263CF8A
MSIGLENMHSGEDLKVLIWRTEWLSYSETFIELQARNLELSQAIYAGLSIDEIGLRLGARAITSRFRVLKRLQRFALSRFGMSRRLDTLVKAEGIQVIHAHFGPDANAIYKFCRRHSLPLVITLHGYDVSSMATGQDSRARKYRRKLAAAMQYASRIICVSEYIRAMAIELGARADVTLVHYVGVEIPAAVSAFTNRGGLLFVGRLVEKKGLDDLLEAISLLPGVQRQTALTVIGRGALAKDLQRRASSLGLNVKFRGALSHAEVLDEISSAAVVVVPSKASAGGDVEGLPTVIMEAMSRGIPVIGTYHSGIPEAVRDGKDGLLSPERDPQALAASIERLMTNKDDLVNMGTSARGRAKELFDISIQSRSLDQIYAAVRHEQTNKVKVEAGPRQRVT